MSDVNGPDCGVNGCEREVGHIGGHTRFTPAPDRPEPTAESEYIERAKIDGSYVPDALASTPSPEQPGLRERIERIADAPATDPGMAEQLRAALATEASPVLDADLATAYAAGFRAGVEDEPSHWDDTDEEIAEYGRQYVARLHESAG